MIMDLKSAYINIFEYWIILQESVSCFIGIKLKIINKFFIRMVFLCNISYINEKFILLTYYFEMLSYFTEYKKFKADSKTNYSVLLDILCCIK
jgi:hypothetical protein